MFDQNIEINIRRDDRKNSYVLHRVYESVDDMSLTYVACQKSTENRI